ncbi:hypothetical protein [Paenibacillus sp. 481]|uniref:hypothetical protein n=1 Tax=Paenibacillus sp. 481 TaxID=2835869 RepID=UPI001E47B43A|nr:hypothetical protein [Paenibacillus sp. 481]UHA74503.1 hypothetical protein KIK04_05215 [Paenibacillus sp. 481]
MECSGDLELQRKMLITEWQRWNNERFFSSIRACRLCTDEQPQPTDAAYATDVSFFHDMIFFRSCPRHDEHAPAGSEVPLLPNWVRERNIDKPMQQMEQQERAAALEDVVQRVTGQPVKRIWLSIVLENGGKLDMVEIEQTLI